jgi:hypothetical protein
MRRKDDLFKAQKQSIIELEAELKHSRTKLEYYMSIIGEMMAQSAVARAKETGAWEG